MRALRTPLAITSALMVALGDADLRPPTRPASLAVASRRDDVDPGRSIDAAATATTQPIVDSSPGRPAPAAHPSTSLSPSPSISEPARTPARAPRAPNTSTCARGRANGRPAARAKRSAVHADPRHAPGDGPNVRRWRAITGGPGPAAGKPIGTSSALDDAQLVAFVSARPSCVRVRVGHIGDEHLVELELVTPEGTRTLALGPGVAVVLARGLTNAVSRVRRAQRRTT